MTLQTADRIKERTATTGPGALTLAGASTGYRAFSEVCANGDTAYYCIDSGTAEWEVGLGTWSTGGTLARTTVLASSNAGVAVDLGAGIKDVFLTAPALTLARLSTAAMLALSGANTGDQTIALTGDVTGSGTGSFAATIAPGAVTLAKQASLAANSIIGNNTGAGATPLALTAAQVKTLLAIANTDVSGLGTLSTQNGTFSGTHSGASSGTNTGDETAAGILAKLITVDGAGSLLDADFLDGQSSAAFALASHTHAEADVTGLVADLAARLTIDQSRILTSMRL